MICFFILGSLAHLWLGDAAQKSWLGSNLCFLLGLGLLAWRGSAAGWLMCAVAKAISLLFLRDHLTQSLVLWFIASAGTVFLTLDCRQKNHATENLTLPTSEPSPTIHAFLKVCRAITILVYALAALHKLNRDFFSPEVSCATHGLNQLTMYWNLSIGPLSESVLTALAVLIIAVEAGIALLYLCGLRRVAWWVAVAFHIPLTLTMAPAYAFIMLAGHAAFLRTEDFRDFRAVFTRYAWHIALGSAALTALSLGLHAKIPEVSMIPKELLLWALLLGCTLLLARHGLARRTHAARTHGSRSAERIAWAFILLFAMNGLLPYLGLRFNHTGAMVSNLRIDQGCWNSLIFPESLRITDDYIRIDKAHMHRPGFMPEYETTLLTQLWNGPQILQMRRNWCKPALRPFYMEGTFRNRTFIIEDLCDNQPLPFSGDGILGINLFPDSLRFQRNLLKTCPTTCIH